MSGTKIPEDSQVIIGKFADVVENPSDPDTLWVFVKDYLTYLESKTQMVVPLIDPESKQTLIQTIKKKSNESIPWGVYNCFLTISNIGSNIAQKETLDDTDKYYIMYVMLAFEGDSPVFQFTQLLQNLQSQDESTKKVYESLDSKFLEACSKYDQKKPVKKKNILNKTIFRVAGKDIKGLHLLIALAILVVIVVAIFLYMNNKSKSVEIELAKSDFGSTNGSVIGKYNSDVSSVYSG